MGPPDGRRDGAETARRGEARGAADRHRRAIAGTRRHLAKSARMHQWSTAAVAAPWNACRARVERTGCERGALGDGAQLALGQRDADRERQEQDAAPGEKRLEPDELREQPRREADGAREPVRDDQQPQHAAA